eukprot:scaffold43071_cov314-Skeletonema_marinoi.AAC.1
MTSQYPLPPPLDGDNNTSSFHQEETTAQQGWSSQEGLPPSAVVEQFGSTATTTATATTVVDYNNDAETHEFLDIPVGNNENGVDINSLHPPPMMHLPEQHDELVQQPQQQHPNEGLSSPHQPVMEGAMMPSLGDQQQQQQQQQQIPYDFNGNNNDPNSRKRAFHGFASSEGVPEAEQNQQELQHSPPPPNLPPVTLPPPPPNHHQYPQDNHHPSHHYPPHQHHHQPEQQQLHHPLQNQEQAMNNPNYVHEQQHQPPPIPHHSSYNSHPPPHYPPHQPQTQHPHYHPHQYYPSYHQHQPQPPSNHRLGYNTDRPTYLFSLPTTDSQSLSDRQCYIRSTFIELFLATAEDVSSRPAKGSQRIHLNQVGIRCAYCVDNNKDAKQKLLQELQHPRVERAVCFPQSISRIYQTVADMQRRHFEKCARIPVQVMGTYKSLKSTRPRGKGKPQGYWESSAREIGLVDSDMGIRV